MSNFPSDTVTFLFTDVEGSTRRWEQDSPAMRSTIERHFAILDAAIAEHNGVRFKTIGDAIQAAFPTAPDAVLSAVAAQRAFAAEDWDSDEPLRVRMALHTGAATPENGDYLAPALNRLARLLAAGSGGQILTTEVTHQLTRDSLPTEISLQNLGTHRLRDLREPEQVFQVNAAGLATMFPPLKTIDKQTNNLPAQLTEFIGREREVDDVMHQLSQGSVRLLTLTGPGGTGKTRLALHVASKLISAYEDGVWLIALATVGNANLVTATMADALGLHESPGVPPLETIRGFLRAKEILLVVDNFEHVIEAAPVVADLLATCPGLQILATSRAPLRIAGEHEYPVPSLGLPSMNGEVQLDEVLASEAVRLFIERARAVRPDFVVNELNAKAVAMICHRLDGLPLAIELAAARIRILSAEAMLARLDSRLTLLTSGGRDRPERQQTLRAAIAWSYDLLAPAEQTLFRRLAVFVGGFSIEEAEAVSNAVGSSDLWVLDGLATLHDNSLIREIQGATSGPFEEPRYGMLQTIREFALEKLVESGELEAANEAHAVYFLDMVGEAETRLTGSDAVFWLDRLDIEHGNLRAAVEWLTKREDAARAVRFAGALSRFWWIRGHIGEGREKLEAALNLGGEFSADVRAVALDGAGVLAETQGDYTRAAVLHNEALALSREIGDKAGIARSLGNLGVLAYDERDFARAESLLNESLAIGRELGDDLIIATALNDLGLVAHGNGDHDTAESYLRDSLSLRRRIGDVSQIARSLNNLGALAFHRKDYSTACDLFEESLALYREAGDKWGVAGALNDLAVSLREMGSNTRAASLLEESLTLYQETGDARNAAVALLNLAGIARKVDKLQDSAEQYREALVQSQTVDDRAGVGDALAGLGGVLAVQGRYEEAARLLGAAAGITAVTEAESPSDSNQFNADLVSVQQAIGNDAFSSQWRAGQNLSLEAAISAAKASKIP